MRNIPVFTTEFGVASLILKEIPYTGIAYVRLQSSLFPEKLLEECGLQPNIVYHAEPKAMAETFEGIQRLFITKPALYQLEAAARLTVPPSKCCAM